MVNSAQMCRAQEARHRQRAADAALDNVRTVALAAAAAWAHEAEDAESREAGIGPTLSAEDRAIAAEFALDGDDA